MRVVLIQLMGTRSGFSSVSWLPLVTEQLRRLRATQKQPDASSMRMWSFSPKDREKTASGRACPTSEQN